MTINVTSAPIRIRPIAPGDQAALGAFYEGLSADSRAARFHGAASGLGARAARDFSCADHRHRQGIVAEARDALGAWVIVGHVCLEPTGDGQAELAIAVADAWQHHGVGRALLTAAVAWARTHGIGRAVASTRWGNAAMIGLIRSLGCPVAFGAEDAGIVDVYVDVPDGLRDVA
jgi:acetyltransferase